MTDFFAENEVYTEEELEFPQKETRRNKRERRRIEFLKLKNGLDNKKKNVKEFTQKEKNGKLFDIKKPYTRKVSHGKVKHNEKAVRQFDEYISDGNEYKKI